MWVNKSFSQNLKTGYEIVKDEYNNSLNRFKELDSKLNMLLVFLAVEITVFGTTYNLFKNVFFRLIYLCVFMSLVFLSLVIILTGLGIKKLEVIDTNNFSKIDTFKVSHDQFLANYIATYDVCINKLERQNVVKARIFAAAIVFVALVFLTFISCLLLNFIF